MIAHNTYFSCRIFFKTSSIVKTTALIHAAFHSTLHAKPVSPGKSYRRLPMKIWWAYLDLNQGPRPYQGRALTN